MIKIENVEVYGWEPSIRGMRNSYNSWDKTILDLCGGSGSWSRPPGFANAFFEANR